MRIFCGIQAPFGCCRLTQHKRFVPNGTHPNPSLTLRTSFMLETLSEIRLGGLTKYLKIHGEIL